MTTSSYSYKIYTDSYRTHTEDRALALEVPHGLVIAVADGVGGRSNGGAAAESAVRQVEKFVAGTARRGVREWQAFAERLDRRLIEDDTCGETTLVVVEITPRLVLGVSAGDSEAWLVLPDGHYDLTTRQIAKPFLGSGAALPIPFRLRRSQAGVLVVASDGLFKYATAVQIEAAVQESDLEQAAANLSRLPRLRSSALPDDLAVCLCRLDASSIQSRVGWPWAGDASWVPSSPEPD